MEYKLGHRRVQQLLDAVNQTGTVTCLTRRSAGLAMTSSTRRTTTASTTAGHPFRPTPTAGMALPTTAPDTTPCLRRMGAWQHAERSVLWWESGRLRIRPHPGSAATPPPALAPHRMPGGRRRGLVRSTRSSPNACDGSVIIGRGVPNSGVSDSNLIALAKRADHRRTPHAPEK